MPIINDIAKKLHDIEKKYLTLQRFIDDHGDETIMDVDKTKRKAGVSKKNK